MADSTHGLSQSELEVCRILIIHPVEYARAKREWLARKEKK